MASQKFATQNPRKFPRKVTKPNTPFCRRPYMLPTFSQGEVLKWPSRDSISHIEVGWEPTGEPIEVRRRLTQTDMGSHRGAPPFDRRSKWRPKNSLFATQNPRKFPRKVTKLNTTFCSSQCKLPTFSQVEELKTPSRDSISHIEVAGNLPESP